MNTNVVSSIFILNVSNNWLEHKIDDTVPSNLKFRALKFYMN